MEQARGQFGTKKNLYGSAQQLILPLVLNDADFVLHDDEVLTAVKLLSPEERFLIFLSHGQRRRRCLRDFPKGFTARDLLHYVDPQATDLFLRKDMYIDNGPQMSITHTVLYQGQHNDTMLVTGATPGDGHGHFRENSHQQKSFARGQQTRHDWHGADALLYTRRLPD